MIYRKGSNLKQLAACLDLMDTESPRISNYAWLLFGIVAALAAKQNSDRPRRIPSRHVGEAE